MSLTIYFCSCRLGPFIWHSRYQLPKSVSNFWQWHHWCSLSRFSLWSSASACQFRSLLWGLPSSCDKPIKANPKLWQGEPAPQKYRNTAVFLADWIHPSVSGEILEVFSHQDIVLRAGAHSTESMLAGHFTSSYVLGMSWSRTRWRNLWFNSYKFPPAHGCTLRNLPWKLFGPSDYPLLIQCYPYTVSLGD